jgi:hypothetical protein
LLIYPSESVLYSCYFTNGSKLSKEKYQEAVVARAAKAHQLAPFSREVTGARAAAVARLAYEFLNHPGFLFSFSFLHTSSLYDGMKMTDEWVISGPGVPRGGWPAANKSVFGRIRAKEEVSHGEELWHVNRYELLRLNYGEVQNTAAKSAFTSHNHVSIGHLITPSLSVDYTSTTAMARPHSGTVTKPNQTPASNRLKTPVYSHNTTHSQDSQHPEHPELL